MECCIEDFVHSRLISLVVGVLVVGVLLVEVVGKVNVLAVHVQ